MDGCGPRQGTAGVQLGRRRCAARVALRVPMIAPSLSSTGSRPTCRVRRESVVGRHCAERWKPGGLFLPWLAS
eukprot:14513685-Ditylum_brightwellii.AAC.1